MLFVAVTAAGAAAVVGRRSVVEGKFVVASGPVCGRISLLSMVQPVLVITVPLASGVLTDTTSWTEPEAPEVTVPRFQVTTPAASAPPPVAPTKVVPAGRASEITTPVASALPAFEYDSV